MSVGDEDNIRLQKYLAICGVASRRAAEKLIQDGRVKVNGQIVSLGFKVGKEDKVYVDDKLITRVEKKIYIMLNKPVNVISSAKDQFGRKTVLDFINGINKRLYPVGRLDYDSEGLILLTNDGNFTNKVLHPSNEIVKTYVVKLNKPPKESELDKIRKGVYIDGKLTSPCEVEYFRKDENKYYEVKIHEGRNRQVRRMFDSIGYKVIELKRVAIGKLNLGDLKPGQWRYLSDKDIKLIFQ